VTSAAGIHHPGHVASAPPTLQTIPEAITENIATARARTHEQLLLEAWAADPPGYLVDELGPPPATRRPRGPGAWQLLALRVKRDGPSVGTASTTPPAAAISRPRAPAGW
jgi:hypothetical protein